MDPTVHARSSAEKFGGQPSDYIAIHEFMDCMKAAVGAQLHRVFTHHSGFIDLVLPRVFGAEIQNNAGDLVSVREIGLQHVGEDFGREDNVPTTVDMTKVFNDELPTWLDNGLHRHDAPEGLVPHLRKIKFEGETKSAPKPKTRKKVSVKPKEPKPPRRSMVPRDSGSMVIDGAGQRSGPGIRRFLGRPTRID